MTGPFPEFSQSPADLALDPELLARELAEELLGDPLDELDDPAVALADVAAECDLGLDLLGMIVGLPVLRAVLLVYTLLPLSRNRAPYAHAVPAFRLSEALRPWSMAEIFVIGTAIALVKVAGLANISLGPAFWAFCGLILVNAASFAFTSATTIWDAIEDGGLKTDGREMTPDTVPRGQT